MSADPDLVLVLVLAPVPRQELLSSGIIDIEHAKNLSQTVLQEYENEHKNAAAQVSGTEGWLASNWQGDAINSLTDSGKRPFNPTGVRIETLRNISHNLHQIPVRIVLLLGGRRHNSCCFYALILFVPFCNALPMPGLQWPAALCFLEACFPVTQSEWQEGFDAHPTVIKLFKDRLEQLEKSRCRAPATCSNTQHPLPLDSRTAFWMLMGRVHMDIVV